MTILMNIAVKDVYDFLGAAAGIGVTEVEMTAEDDVLRMVCVDPAHVTLMKSSLTLAYGVDEPESFTLDLRDLNKALGQYGKGDTVDLHVEKGKLTVRAPGKRRSIRLLDREGQPPRIPTLDLETIEVPTDALRQATKFAGDISDHFTLDTLGGVLTISASDGVDSAEFEVCPTGVEVRSMYPADYFSAIIKSLPATEVTTLAVASDFPIRIEARTDKVSTMYLVAPRIEKD